MTTPTPAAPAPTREEWLTRAAAKMAPWYAEQGHPLPATRISTGFPSKSALSAKSRRIGECWSGRASADGAFQIFISPLLADGVRALDVLAHELVHAAVGTDAGHGPLFRKVAEGIGLAGKMTATVASPELALKLGEIVQEIGPYPHAALNPKLSGQKQQVNRQRKAECPGCGYIIRMSAKWAEVGMPTCVCGEDFVYEDDGEDGDE